MFRTDTKLSGWTALLLGVLPFLLLGCLYLWGSYHLHQMEMQDAAHATASSRLMPTPSQIWDGFKSVAFEKDRKGLLKLWVDTGASFARFAVGMLIAVVPGTIIGLYMGAFPLLDALCYRFFVVIDKVPPLLVLPILFMVFDVGEVYKIALIVIGVCPNIALDAYARVKEIQKEQFFKAQTLGATESEIAWCVVLPQIFPKMIETMRLNLKGAWCYVLAGEGIAASMGIGYRTYLLQRYVAMDIIIAYVIWATLLMMALDYAFQWWGRQYRWVGK